jgi:hypothetical protein
MVKIPEQWDPNGIYLNGKPLNEPKAIKGRTGKKTTDKMRGYGQPLKINPLKPGKKAPPRKGPKI